jgi:hypothetical protein
MNRRTSSAFARHFPWLWGRKKRLAAATRCLQRNGWTIEDLSATELVASCLSGGISYTITFRPPEKAVMGWVGNEELGEPQQPPLPECFYEFMR